MGRLRAIDFVFLGPADVLLFPKSSALLGHFVADKGIRYLTAPRFLAAAVHVDMSSFGTVFDRIQRCSEGFHICT